jgi:hypothetical protein
MSPESKTPESVKVWWVLSSLTTRMLSPTAIVSVIGENAYGDCMWIVCVVPLGMVGFGAGERVGLGLGAGFGEGEVTATGRGELVGDGVRAGVAAALWDTAGRVVVRGAGVRDAVGSTVGRREGDSGEAVGLAVADGCVCCTAVGWLLWHAVARPRRTAAAARERTSGAWRQTGHPARGRRS